MGTSVRKESVRLHAFSKCIGHFAEASNSGKQQRRSPIFWGEFSRARLKTSTGRNGATRLSKK